MGDYTPNDKIYAVALACQTAYQYWAKASDPEERAQRSQAYHTTAEALLDILRPHLNGLAHKWYRSAIASDMDSLILNLFTAILLALPRLRLDPSKNVRGLLLTVAHRGMYDLYRSDLHGGRRGAASEGEDKYPGLREVQLDPEAQEIADPASFDGEDSWIRQIDDRACVAAIEAFWHSTLSATDRQIMAMRLENMPFKEIANCLNHVLEEATIRQRYRRILERTRLHLRQQGMRQGQY